MAKDKKNGNGWRTYAVIFGIILAIGTMVWATAIQWDRADKACTRTEVNRKDIDANAKRIENIDTEQTIRFEYIKESLGKIEKKLE